QIMEMGSLDGIVSCVELGVVFALLPKSYLNKVADKVSLSCFEINTESAHFTTYLVEVTLAMVLIAVSTIYYLFLDKVFGLLMLIILVAVYPLASQIA
ncbi:hypothetical protein RFW90_17370, partial [Acinetobacter baumannii]|nr:hypothetical protein [Acinetobacter baumannii]